MFNIVYFFNCKLIYRIEKYSFELADVKRIKLIFKFTLFVDLTYQCIIISSIIVKPKLNLNIGLRN